MAQIIGYRKDRLGARVIALGNLLRLEDKFGASVRLLWPDGADDYDMSITDPDFPIFDPAFATKYLRQIPQGQRPEVGDLTDIDALRSHVPDAVFETRLAKGEMFYTNEGMHPLLFANEQGPAAVAGLCAALARIVWAPRVQAVFDQAIASLGAVAGTCQALHVRRGDVLDKAPWCHKNWVAKFAPDEFYTSVMSRPDTATVLFSDTAAVVAKMAASSPTAVVFDDLIDAPDLSPLQRDLVALLVMAHCQTIVAPSLSAFSTAAALIGGINLTDLPNGIGAGARTAAYDGVLARVLDGPDTFHNTGDFAQSLGYAFRHAPGQGQHHALYAQLKSVMEQGQDYAFYLPLAMALAIACDAPAHAQTLDGQAKASVDIWPEDRMICAALGRVADHAAGQTKPATVAFVDLYLARRKSNPDLDALAHYFFAKEASTRQLFQLDDIVVQTLCDGPDKGRLFLLPASGALPLWITGADWPEMFEKAQITKNITKAPDLAAKSLYIPADIKAAELAFFRDQTPLPTDTRSVMLLSVYASALGLSGRYKRALALVDFCCQQMPDHPIFHKRAGNLLALIGDDATALWHFKRTAALLPHHPGVMLARAGIAHKHKDYATAANLLTKNARKGWLPMAYFKTWEMSLRKMKSKALAQDVIREAAHRFPTHEIFTKQWSDKL